MSLTVTPEVLTRAQSGTLTEDDFYACVKSSLPFAVDVVHHLAHQADASESDMAEFAPDTLDPENRGQILRAMASDAIRNALTMRFGSHQSRAPGIIIGFQNCHRVAVFLDTELGREEFRKWASKESQILAQNLNLVDC